MFFFQRDRMYDKNVSSKSIVRQSGYVKLYLGLPESRYQQYRLRCEIIHIMENSLIALNNLHPQDFLDLR